MSREYVFTSESVTEGHPDKMCDQLSDAVLDAIITREQELADEGFVSDVGTRAAPEYVRCAIECFTTTGQIVVGGEIRTHGYVDIPGIVRQVVRDIGYDRAKYGFDADTCGVLIGVHEQSPDIAQGVDESFEAQHGQGADPIDLVGAGDQGMMFGYACNETSQLMPMPIYLAQRLAERLTAVRRGGVLTYLRPDGKTQVSVKYVDGKAVSVEKILISTQHADGVDIENLLRPDLIEHVINPVFDEEGLDYSGAEIYVNPTGRFVVGGPMGDTGLTGRKIIVDTYGGMGRHGGGAFSGKDCTKVDRSAAYAARWVAKNIVAAGLADRAELQLAYAIGVAHPLSVMVETFGTEKVPVEEIERAVTEVFDLRPGAIIRDLDLRRPIYRKTAAYGHFGRDDGDFTWERTDRVDALKKAVGL
jgi:S-adenosylmethionine synthetase